MTRIEARRLHAVDRLGTEYAAGRLRTGSLEFRVAEALRASSDAGLDLALWGLPDRRAVVRRWHRLQDVLLGGPIGLHLAGTPDLVLTPTTERQTWSVGRSSRCTVRLDDDTVSRHHARIAHRGGCWTVEDLDSSNGTYVNGVRIDRRTLRPDDRIVFGRTAAHLTRRT